MRSRASLLILTLSLLLVTHTFSNPLAAFAAPSGIVTDDQPQLDWFSPEGPNKVMMKALLTDEKLTREEAFEFAVQMSIFLGGLVQSEQLHKQGLLDSEFLQTRRSIYRPYLEMPRVRKWWMRAGKEFYSHSEAFDLINRMIEEIETSEAPGSATNTAVDG